MAFILTLTDFKSHNTGIPTQRKGNAHRVQKECIYANVCNILNVRSTIFLYLALRVLD